MFGYTMYCKQITNAGGIERPNKIIGYNFKNTGVTMATIRRKDQSADQWVWQLEVGEAMDTRVHGGMDMTNYAVDFSSLNDSDPDSQQSELLITFFVGL